MARALRSILPPAVASIAIAVLVGVVFGDGRLLNYDTSYSLLWGSQLADGQVPDVQVPYAPTQHPLATLFGALLALPGLGASAPYGAGATTAWELFGLLCLGVLGWVVFALGRAWFGVWAGVAAALIVLTREPVLSFGVRAYVDIPYVCLLLGAVLAETRRPRSGTPVLVLLMFAGLLRPEAWLFSFAYAAYLRYHGDLRLSQVVWAVAAPVIWAFTDLIQTGNPIYSFTETQDAAEALGRITGITNVPETLPRRLGEILREPGLLAAGAGGVLSLALLRDRARIGAVSGLVAVGAFVVLATAGLPILTRYLLGPGAILAIFAGAGLFGWQQLEPGHRWRARWIAISAVCAIAFAAFVPNQIHRLERTNSALADQRSILLELRDLSPEAGAGCALSVPNRRPVPQLSLWTDRDPASFRSAQEDKRYTLPAFSPANADAAKRFILNARDTVTYLPPTPRPAPGVQRIVGRWWVLTGRCP